MEEKKEIWKAVVNFEENYQVSNLGRIRSLTRTIILSTGKSITVKGKLLSVSCTNGGGYNPINLYKEKKKYRCLVHSIVAEAFIGPRPLKHDVNHIDGVKTNNCADNLEYCTRSENMLHAFENGLCKKTRKTSKTGINSVKWMVLHTETGIYYESIAEAARTYNLTVGRLEKQLKGIRKLTLPFVRIEKGVNPLSL